MTEPHIRDLESADAATRRAAIIAAARTKDSAALPALNAISRADPDLDLRVLALKAVRTIERHAATEAEAEVQARAAAIMAGKTTPEPERDSQTRARRARELGQFYLTAAMNYHMAHDRPRTLENLGVALQHDPTLAEERYVQNFAEQVFDLDHESALALLRDPAALVAQIERLGGKRKLRRIQRHGEGAEVATWGRVASETGVLWLLAVIGAALIVFLAPAPLIEIVESYTYNITARIAERLTAIEDSSAALRLGYALAGGTGFTLNMLLTSLLIDAAAAYLQAGDGARVYFMRQVMWLNAGMLLASVPALLLILLSVDDLAVRAALLSMSSVVILVVYVSLLSAITGRVYAFDSVRGCYTIGIVLLALAAVTMVIVYAVTGFGG